MDLPLPQGHENFTTNEWFATIYLGSKEFENKYCNQLTDLVQIVSSHAAELKLLRSENESLREENCNLSDKIEKLNLKLDALTSCKTEMVTHSLDLKSLHIESPGLDKNNADLYSEINDIKELHIHRGCKNEIMVAGIPNSCKLELSEVTKQIFSKLGVPKMFDNVCNYRKCKSKIDSDLCKKQKNTYSFVLKLKSKLSYKSVLMARRKYGVINCADIFPGENIGKVSIYEILSKYKYDLKLAARSRAQTYNFKHVWIFNGNVCVRKNDDSEILNIVTNNDLRKIS